MHFEVKHLNRPASDGTLRILSSLESIDAAQWDALVGDYPFLRHAFLRALESSGCVGEGSGWDACFLTLWYGDQLDAAMPLYRKTHSYGEYVFDWAWADAYARNGLRYYPKLVNAVPFTPVTGPRLLAATPEQRAALVDAALSLAQRERASSLHCLFPVEPDLAVLRAAGFMVRTSVQFHWYNQDYADFTAFLAGFSHAKRKKIKQERKHVSATGLTFERLTGAAIEAWHWEFFERCYRATYYAHGSTPYLNRAFFEQIGERMGANVLLVLASRAGKPIAAALNFFDTRNLYGRYWGTLEAHSGLHFETCYYQAIEFCIERGIAHFDAGAQGEHKLARGFVPQKTHSAHWLAHPQFAAAVETYLGHEGAAVEEHFSELSERSPYRRA